MVNIRISKPTDNLVLVSFHIFESQKTFLAELRTSTGKNASATIRDLISSQMDSNDVELSSLTEELRDHEVQVNIIKARVAELEANSLKQQDTVTFRDDLFKTQADKLLEILIREGGFWENMGTAIKTRVQGMNQKLSGTGVQQFTVDELTQAVLEQAKSMGVKVYNARLR